MSSGEAIDLATGAPGSRSGFGGRWNPRRVFPTIYLADPLRSRALEFERRPRPRRSTPRR
jgi:RES domain-containing protein